MRQQRKPGALNCCLLLLVACIFCALRTNAQDPPGGRYALVIGNSNYTDNTPVSGVQDAERMADYLEQLHFTVTANLTDTDLKSMRSALKDLKGRISKASVVVFYFSGHGFQDGGENYLAPKEGTAVPTTALALKEVKDALALAPKAVKLVILDACRDDQHLASGRIQGLNEKQAPDLGGTLYAFATGPNLTAPASTPDGYSPYSLALMNSIREPGLSFIDLLARVKASFEKTNQMPSYLNNGVPTGFCLQPAVTLPISIPADSQSDQLVVLNGEIVLDSTQQSSANPKLLAGHNELLSLVSNGKTYRNGHSWERTEGWSYKLNLTLPDGMLPTLQDHEDIPFKDGPHHGKVFRVARVVLTVDPTSVAPVQSEVADTVANDDATFHAQDQGTLYRTAVKGLPLDKILDPTGFPNLGIIPGATLSALLHELLTTGTFLGQTVADPAQIFFAVHGNVKLEPLVESCITAGLNDRIQDLRVSLMAALQRNPRPFDTFDQALSRCVHDTAAQDPANTLPLGELQVWTAIEDDSAAPAPTPGNTAAASAPTTSQDSLRSPASRGTHE